MDTSKVSNIFKLTGLFEYSKKHALHKLSSLHKPLRFNDCMILLHSVMECDNVSMSIIICLVCSDIIIGVAMLSLGKCVLFMFVDLVFVCLCMVCGFTSWVGCKSDVLSWGSLEVLFVVVLPMFYVNNV